MNRKSYYQVRQLVGGDLTATQQKVVDSMPTQALKESRIRMYESYNTQLKATRDKIARGEIKEPHRAKTDYDRAADYAQSLAKEQADAGGFEKWSYGDNKPIIFKTPNQNIRSSTGDAAVAIRKNKWNNWQIDFTDRSREFVPTGDERFFLIGENIAANDIPELIEKIQGRVEAIKEQQTAQQARMSGFDRFMEGLNDTLIDVADVGQFFTPTIASAAYETFRPEKSSERRERQVNEFVEGALQSNTQAEKTYKDLQPGGRLHGILEYDPELANKIEQFNKYGPMLRRTLEGGELSPSGSGKYALHAVIIDNKVPYETALKSAQSITKKKGKIFMRPTEESFRFRNIPKTKFIPTTFRSKVVNPQITLVFGKLR